MVTGYKELTHWSARIDDIVGCILHKPEVDSGNDDDVTAVDRGALPVAAVRALRRRLVAVGGRVTWSGAGRGRGRRWWRHREHVVGSVVLRGAGALRYRHHLPRSAGDHRQGLRPVRYDPALYNVVIASHGFTRAGKNLGFLPNIRSF